MNKLRKLMVIVLAGVMVTSFSACAKGGDSQSENSVEFYTDKADEEKNAKGASQIISDKTGLGLKYISTPDLSSYQTNIKQSLGSSSAPGLFTWWVGTQLKELVEKDMVEDLTSQWEEYYIKNGVDKEIADSLTIDGKIYGAPLNVIYNGIIYNKEIFDKYNLKEPNTFDEFLTVCETLKANGITPIGIGGTWQSFCWPQALMGSMDPDLYDQWTSGEVKFTDQRVKDVFYQWIDMINKGYFSSQEQDQVKNFANEKSAMIYNATNLLVGLNQDYGMTSGEKIDIFTLPSNSEDKKATIFYEVAAILVAKNSDNKENGKKILQSYYDKEVQQDYADESGIAASAEVELKDPLSKKIVEETNMKDKYSLKLRYYEKFSPAVVNLSIDEYWKILDNPTKEQVNKSLETIQKEQDKEK